LGLFDGLPAVWRLGSRLDQLMDLLDSPRLHLRLEVRRGRKLVLQGLAQQMVHGAREVRSDGGLRDKARAQRYVVLVEIEVVQRVEGPLREDLQPVSRVQVALDP